MWGKIDIEKWKEVPCISGRIATEADVKSGIAVFYISGGSKPYDIELPLCAVQIDTETNQRTPCIAIQIEQSDNGVTVGVRYLEGGNGVITSEEVELYEEPNEDFNL